MTQDFAETSAVMDSLLSKIEDDNGFKCKGDCSPGMVFYTPEDHLPSCKLVIHKQREILIKACVDKRTREILLSKKIVDTESINAVKDFLKTRYSHGGCLILAGIPGSGKTLASAYAIQQLKTGLMVYAPNLQKDFLNDEKTEKLKSTGFLVIDDLGIEYKQEWLNSSLDSLIHHRHGNMLPTIFTTNLNNDDFKKTYSSRITSRLHEWSDGKFINTGKDDLRKNTN